MIQLSAPGTQEKQEDKCILSVTRLLSQTKQALQTTALVGLTETDVQLSGMTGS